MSDAVCEETTEDAESRRSERMSGSSPDAGDSGTTGGGDNKNASADTVFIGEHIVRSVRGLDFGDVEVRTDVFSGVARDHVDAIRRLVGRWRSHQDSDDGRDPVPAFVADDGREYEGDEGAVDDDGSDGTATPDDADSRKPEATEHENQRAEIRVDLVWQDDACTSHGRDMATCEACGGWRYHCADCTDGYDEDDPCYCPRCELVAGCRHCTHGGPLYYLLRFSSVSFPSNHDDDSRITTLPSSSSSSSPPPSTETLADRVGAVIGYGLLVADSGCATYKCYESDAVLRLASSAASALGNLAHPIRDEIARNHARRRAAVHEALRVARVASIADADGSTQDPSGIASEPAMPLHRIDADILPFLAL